MQNAFYQLWLDRVRKALAACDMKLRVNGEAIETLKLRTDLLVELGRIDEAIACHERLLVLQGSPLQPMPAPAPIDRQSLLALLGQTSAAAIAEIDWQNFAGAASGAGRGPAAFILRGINHPAASPDGWPQTRVALFDAGYLPLLRRLKDCDREMVVYGRSDLLTDTRAAGVSHGPAVSMWNLGRNGRFGNQLWQYLFLVMYGLRNGLVVETPAWEGEDHFGFHHRRPTPRTTLVYQDRRNDHLELWNTATPPSDVNFSGYFQDVPPSWTVHRDFIRRLFTFRKPWATALDSLMTDIRAQRATLVAVHIRRGDYRDPASPFRPLPTAWYQTALRALWPRLQGPILHVASDQLGVAEELSDFDQLSTSTLSALPREMPGHVRDWIILREADVLLAGNSSFSMMAALQARVDQACLVADYGLKSFVPFDLWQAGRYRDRFANLP